MLSSLRNQHYPYHTISNLRSPGYSSPLSPRERYLASLADAEAAEAELIASEAERFRRDEEELLLRRRLDELEYERHISRHIDYGEVPRNHSFDGYSLHRHLDEFDHTPDRSSYYSTHDGLAALRRELEEEEFRIARERKQKQREALRNKQLREAEKLTLLRKVEENRLELIRRREQEEQNLLNIRLDQRQAEERRCTILSDNQAARCPTVRFGVDSASKESLYYERPKRARCAFANGKGDLKTAQQALQLLFGNQESTSSATTASPERRQQEISKNSALPEELLKLLFGESTQPEQKSATPFAAGFNALKAAKKQNESETTPKTTTSTDSSVKSAEEFWKALFEQIGLHASEEKPVAGESSTGTKVQTQQPTNTTVVNYPAPSTNLKDQLEARLNNDEAIEIRDTIQAILASLADTTYGTEAASAGGFKPNPTSSTSSSSATSHVDVDGKGKGKVETPSTSSSPEPTSNDVLKSMTTVHNIETAFTVLQQDFAFPAQLDFTPTSSAAPSPVSSDTETSTPSITKLTYTSRNQPVRYYEQSLSGLLSQLDGIESFGNVEVRTMRKEVVAKVEGALDELEREVEGRWKARLAKDRPVSEQVVTNDASEARNLEQPATSETAGQTLATSVHNTVDEPQSSSTPSVLVKEKETSEGEHPVSDVDQKETEVLSTIHDQPSEKSNEYDVESEGVTEPEAGEVDDTHNDGSTSTLDPPSPPLNQSSTFYPPISGDTSTTSSTTASVTTIRPYDLDVETASTSSEEEAMDREEEREPESDSDGFLLSEASSTDDKKTKRQVEVQEEVGSDWSEVEA